MRFNLPSCIAELIEARNRVRDHYAGRIGESPAHNRLKFTLDGNLLGDLGEALAVELFGIKLVAANAFEGIDGFAPDGRTKVQVKVTASGRGPAFRQTEMHADHLVFFDLDLSAMVGTVIYNGPEREVRALLKGDFPGQRSISAQRIKQLGKAVPDGLRLAALPNPSWLSE